MRKLFFPALALVAFFQPSHAETLPIYDEKKMPAAAVSYLERFAPLAVREMELHGIPASITLAQALVETANGTSAMAVHDLNHFGIKCHKNWPGQTTFSRDDDHDADGNLIESCFRKYQSVEESYDDRSKYLKSQPRYAELFTFEKDDYESWARGLKKAGYATSATYVEALLGKIESMELWRFDQMSSADFAPTAFQRPEKAEHGQILGEKMPDRHSKKPLTKRIAAFLPPPPAPNGSPSIVARRLVMSAAEIR